MVAERGERAPVARKPARRPASAAELNEPWQDMVGGILAKFEADSLLYKGVSAPIDCRFAIMTLLRPVMARNRKMPLEALRWLAEDDGTTVHHRWAEFHKDVKPAQVLRMNQLLMSLVRVGLPPASCTELVEKKILTKPELHRLVIKPRTLQHRLAEDKPLSPEESDKAVRVARVWDEACRVFGSAEKAGHWLRRPTRQLSGEKPIDLLDTEVGARQVENALGEIAHGMAA